MELVTIYKARGGAEAQMICSTLEQLGIEVLEITNLGPWGETPMLSSFPIQVARPQAAEAREVLTEMGFACEES